MFLKTLRAKLRGAAGDLARESGDYWSMSDVDERVRDRSHWFGEGRWRRERWLAYGDFFFDLARRRIQEAAGRDWLADGGDKTALEWGCGGGAVARVLGERFGFVYGLDISAATLRECEKRMGEFSGRGGGGAFRATGAGRAGNFLPVLFPAAAPEEVLRIIPSDSIDFMVSIGVFKHFPSQDYTGRVLRVMARLLKEGGFLFVQIRYFDGEEKYRPKDRDYARNVITMTSFTAPEFAARIEDAGLLLRRREQDGDGEDERHAYYLLSKPTTLAGDVGA
ncbi:MAG: methyltransferase domain-containing protein [Pseudomonadota bacterium]|nr:methyltransferase domain-containing protein [Pseudomonadota bacterium]